MATREPIAHLRFITFKGFKDAVEMCKALKGVAAAVRQERAPVTVDIEVVETPRDLSEELSKPAKLIMISGHASIHGDPWIGPGSLEKAVFLEDIDARIPAEALLMDACNGGSDEFMRFFAANLADPQKQTAYVGVSGRIYPCQSITLWSNLLLALLGVDRVPITAATVADAAHRAEDARKALTAGVPSGNFSTAKWPKIEIIADLASAVADQDQAA